MDRDILVLHENDEDLIRVINDHPILIMMIISKLYWLQIILSS